MSTRVRLLAKPSAEALLLAATVTAFVAGGAFWVAGSDRPADGLWIAGTVIALIPSLWWVVAGLRRQNFGVDIIASLALAGTLIVGEYAAGALIGVMLATGRLLDASASRRARKDLSALIDRSPSLARRRDGAQVTVIAVDDVRPGDVLSVGNGEIVPADGWLHDDAVLDESVLTGEPLPRTRARGDGVRSGAVNAGGTFELTARSVAAESTFAGIVRMAGDAAADRAPVVRIADRLAVWFVPLALGVAGISWLVSGSMTRAVAVLVVATPCPLLLAAPIAIVAGLSRASRMGVIIRDGGALESLGRAHTLMVDKTGTLTTGRPEQVAVTAAPGDDPVELLRLAASLEQLSPHVFATAIVGEANRRGLELTVPTAVQESAGRGVSGLVDGRAVEVGARSTPDGDWARAVARGSELDGAAVAWIEVDGRPAGAIAMSDPIRPDAPRTLRRLRSAGIERIVLLTGDHPATAVEIGTLLGIDEVFPDQSPADKVAHVREERAAASTVMVGDGVNDAPALAGATVGVALGARGSTASAAAADVILTTDSIEPLATAMEIARRSRRIALQSAGVGMGLSLAAMIVAAFGFLPPTAGALLQEAIDVAVILNALRALRAPQSDIKIDQSTDVLLHRFAAEHDALREKLALLTITAQRLVDLYSAHHPETTDEAAELNGLREVDDLLTTTILPHEHAEEDLLYPALAKPLGSSEATVTMSRMHAEIDRLGRRVHAHRLRADRYGRVTDDQRIDVIATLYGLHALLRLHFSQEEQTYFALASTSPADPVTGETTSP
ncbi:MULTISPECIES: heavy metal translocating P-type ATPase [Gordonia]|uniref:heavy metal translocating P-type ATPase n=1 Tax=Gordonia TaxID=2053 RepID=UPI001EEFB7D8|nr:MULTISPECIES: heavy metal translocating P-type ATPase [Gordonia]UKO93347.1 cadmium-translocating P-type ATPase [Gordonia amicalis]